MNWPQNLQDHVNEMRELIDEISNANHESYVEERASLLIWHATKIWEKARTERASQKAALDAAVAAAQKRGG